MTHRSLLLLTLLLLAGCQSNPAKKEAAAPAEDTETVEQALAEAVRPDTDALAETETEPARRDDLWHFLTSGFGLSGVRHPAIDREVKRFSARADSLTRQLARGEPYLYYILHEVRKRGMPTEIALVPCIESGFQPVAYSRHGAAGLWQFMPATGRYLGLKQDWWYDARRDTVASTRAALDYLEQLNERFDGDWLLTMAAYNAGGGTIARAVRINRKKGKPTDFWSLKLPRETRHYVPRILALARIIADPDAHGITLPEIANDPRFAQVEFEGQLDLKIAAELAEMKPEALIALNPGFNRWATHPEGPHYLLLPVEKADRFRQRLAELPPEKRLRWTRHRIRSGETLSGIARRYGITVAALMKANRLRNHRIRAGKDLIIPLSASAPIEPATPVARQKLKYRVRKGDSLYRIARQFGVRVQDLMRWNRLASNRLRPGQTLTVIRTL